MKNLFAAVLISLLCFCVCSTSADYSISLAGQWTIKMDPANVGLSENWQSQKFTDPVQLPGAMQAQGYGEKPNLETNWIGGSGVEKFDLPQYDKYDRYITTEDYKHPFWLTPNKYYRGVAWYQKQVTIPDNWDGRRILLSLERCHWETTVFVDEVKIGSDSSLVAPHVYDLTDAMSPGDHRLTIRVNNDLIINVGPNSHSVSDHTQSNWNGIVGDMSLSAAPKAYIKNVKIYPDLKSNAATILVEVAGIDHDNTLTLSCKATGAEDLPQVDKELKYDGNRIQFEYPMGDFPKLWDEFTPNIYTMTVQLQVDGQVDEKNVQFGMREFAVNGTRFQINGHPIFLRGTLDCCIFPRTGYPPTDPAEWEKIYTTLKAHGLNHMRFHSWCPPEAAFVAADKIGFYLQVEGPSWANQGATIGDGGPLDAFIYAETKRIMDEYGNHPSFVMYAYGNEPSGGNHKTFLGEFVNYWRENDPRRIYTCASGWPMIPENEYHVTPAPRIQQWGQGLTSIINGEAPRSNYDWREFVSSQDKPVVGHEIGQWCVYPNFDEMEKYTGYLKPKNFEIFYDLLKRNHMEDQAHDFLMASGKLQALCYKAEVEAALRTPGFAGFQLLDIHDFPGQGTALIGILDPFYQSKPYVNAEEFNQFCGITVPLARMDKRTFTNNETFYANLEVSHFGPEPIENAAITWTINTENGEELERGEFEKSLRLDNVQPVGRIEYDLSDIQSAQKLTLDVDVLDHGRNSWDFWVYPKKVNIDASGVLVTSSLDDNIIDKLENGATVLLNLNGKISKEQGAEVAIGFSSIFWNTAWTSDQAPHTLGILCDPDHPLFADFPTEYHTNWQWWDVIHSSQAMILDDFPAELRPLIQPIDTWFYARRLGLLFEAKVGDGKIVVTSIDFENDLNTRLASRQLYAGLLNYMQSANFDPGVALDAGTIKRLYQ